MCVVGKYVYLCVYVCKCTYLSVNLYLHLCMCTDMSVHMCVYVCLYLCMSTYEVSVEGFAYLIVDNL